MNYQEIEELLKRYKEGQCTPEEIHLIHSWYNQRSKTLQNESIDIDYEIWNKKISDQLPSALGQPPKSIWPKIIVAASILLIFSSLIYFANTPKKSTDTEWTKKEKAEQIVPGQYKATLTLADGKKIILSDSDEMEISNSAGISITKTLDGELVYTIDQQTRLTTEQNTLSTGMGETFCINLPDGSKAWLNASSSLKYALSMNTNGKRIVELVGEGYFEVAEDKDRPFIVKTANQDVVVLGTTFNISCYPEDHKITTTLVEGSIKIQNQKQQQYLKPNEQAILENNTLRISKVDPELAIAWKNGLFIFQDEALEDIMKKLARWYNIEVDFRNADKEKLFWGGISRKEDIHKILNKLEQTGGVKFKTQGRRIIVTK